MFPITKKKILLEPLYKRFEKINIFNYNQEEDLILFEPVVTTHMKPKKMDIFFSEKKLDIFSLFMKYDVVLLDIDILKRLEYLKNGKMTKQKRVENFLNDSRLMTFGIKANYFDLLNEVCYYYALTKKLNYNINF